MLLPSEWGTQKRKEEGPNVTGKTRRAPPRDTSKHPTKRQRVDATLLPEAQGTSGIQTEIMDECHVSAYDTISRAISSEFSNAGHRSDSTHIEPQEHGIVLDTILSRLPYQQMLEELFGGDEKMTADVPIVSRVYEESFMRQCDNHDEKPCVMGNKCECMFIDPQFQFIGTEFLLPTEEPSEQAQMCVLCCRKVTQQLFHDMLFKGITFRGVIQRYGNMCDQKGEYARQCMLICPPNSNVHCMPLPIVAHQRNRYSVVVRNGVCCLRQHRVYYEDFQ
eukprot:172772-Rhodomonas_salina.9